MSDRTVAGGHSTSSRESYGQPAGKTLWADKGLDVARPIPAHRSAGEARRVHADPERIEQGMAQLVLTVIELLRQLMERQALRRFERGTLTHDQEEQLGKALMRLSDTMTDLKEQFGLTDDDLNLHLGPLGDLL
jgi:hypothetical protein